MGRVCRLPSLMIWVEATLSIPTIETSGYELSMERRKIITRNVQEWHGFSASVHMRYSFILQRCLRERGGW